MKQCSYEGSRHSPAPLPREAQQGDEAWGGEIQAPQILNLLGSQSGPFRPPE